MKSEAPWLTTSKSIARYLDFDAKVVEKLMERALDDGGWTRRNYRQA